MKDDLLSIVIPVYNEEKDIGDCLKSLEKQSYKNFEILVIDDGSKDKTLEVLKKFRNIKLLKQEHKGPGAARNLGARKARGKILIFVDADMTFDKNYLKYLIKPILEDKNVIGTEEELQIAKNLDNIWSRCQGKIMSDPKQKERKIFRAIRRDKFLKLGGFDSKYGYADDQTFYFKYGLKSSVAKKAVCYHNNPSSLKQVFKQSRWVGASINNPLTITFGIKYFMPIFLILISPLAIPILTLKKCYKNKDFTIVHYMFVFMFARYFGTISGISRKVYSNKNVK